MPAKTNDEGTETPDNAVTVGDTGVLAFGYAGGEGSGWALFFTGVPGNDAPLTALRFAAKSRSEGDSDDRSGTPFYDIVEMHLAQGDGLTGRDLRALSLGQIEAAVNHPANAERMARYVTSSGGGIGFTLSTDLASLTAPGRPRSRRPRMQVRVPEGHKKPDSFYEQVAYRYGWLQGEGVKSPAEELAEANGVPTTTVHRWVKEARRRGIMSSGQRAPRKAAQ